MILKNLFLTTGAQIYLSAVGIVTLPILAGIVGAASFGLISVYTTLQAWFQLLDLGISPTLGREVSRWKSGTISKNVLQETFKSIVFLSLAISLVCVSIYICLTKKIASEWLQTESIDIAIVQFNLILMAPIFVLRFVSNIIKSMVSGLEDFSWLSKLNVYIGTARFLIALPVLMFLNGRLEVFFIYQIGVSLVELIALICKAEGVLQIGNWFARIDLRVLTGKLSFTGSIAITAIIWSVMTQLDKLFLSKFVNLTEFGYYTLATTLAGGILLLLMPITTVFCPRLIKLKERNDVQGFESLYYDMASLSNYLISPIILLMVFFPHKVLFAWSGNFELVDSTSIVLVLFALGNAFLVASTFQYFVQLANGNLKLHLIVNLITIVLYVPLVFYSCYEWKQTGAASVWLFTNAMTFLLWVPYVHSKFIDRNYFDWVLQSVIYPYGLPAFAALGFWCLDIGVTSRSGNLLYLFVACTVMYIPNLFIIFKNKSRFLQA